MKYSYQVTCIMNIYLILLLDFEIKLFLFIITFKTIKVHTSFQKVKFDFY
jgi:hypothetical protein